MESAIAVLSTYDHYRDNNVAINHKDIEPITTYYCNNVKTLDQIYKFLKTFKIDYEMSAAYKRNEGKIKSKSIRLIAFIRGKIL